MAQSDTISLKILGQVHGWLSENNLVSKGPNFCKLLLAILKIRAVKMIVIAE
jgi:hypothetical protein